MERLAMQDLIKWKEFPYRKPLIVKGVRQVGKTWLLKEFGRKFYSNTAYFNFDEYPEYREFFSHTKDVKRIIPNLAMASGQDIQPERTLLIFDEIQDCPEVINSLKYFCENAPEYHVACAGSLLGISLAKPSSFPVGKVDFLSVYPLNLHEFLMATGSDNLAAYLKELDEISPIPEAFFNPLAEKLKMFFVTGGMPEVVKAYVDGKGLERVRRIQNTILSNYDDDISKHADPRTAIRIHQVWMSMAQQLSKENKKFVYAHIQKGARAKDYETAITWLIDAGLIYRIPCVTKPCIPLKFYEEVESFKLYYVDCGLMGALSEAPADQILIGDNIFIEYKGAFTEQYVLQQMLTKHNTSFFYYHPENSDQEVEAIKEFYRYTRSYQRTMQHFGLTSKGSLHYMLNHR